MNYILVIVFAAGGLLVLMALGFPVAFCLFAVSIIGYLIFSGPHVLATLPTGIFTQITTDVLLAIPLFIFMAAALEFSGVIEQLFDVVHKWLAGLRGGLAMAVIVASAFLAAMVGLAAPAVVTLGLVAYPQMIQRGYEKKLSAGTIMMGGMLGPIIPPSLPMILVGGITGVSVGQLFMAGVVPGVLAAIVAMTYIGIRCRLNPGLAPIIPHTERPSWKAKFLALPKIIPTVFLIVLVLGGIWGGIFTPTEGGGIGASGAILCAAINRRLSWKNLHSALVTTAKLLGFILLMASGGWAFSSLLGITGVHNYLADIVAGLALGPQLTVLIFVLILLIMGMFIDALPVIFMTLSSMFLIVVKVGADPLWFTFIYVFCLVLGALTPPFGFCLFYMKGLAKDLTMQDIYSSSLPFVVVMIVVLALVFVFPSLATFFPGMMVVRR